MNQNKKKLTTMKNPTLDQRLNARKLIALCAERHKVPVPYLVESTKTWRFYRNAAGIWASMDDGASYFQEGWFNEPNFFTDFETAYGVLRKPVKIGNPTGY